MRETKQKKLNVWLIQISEPLPIEDGARKLRTAILADKLVDRGHNVLWWTSAFDHHQKEWIFREDKEVTVRDGLRIKALKSIGYKKNFSLARFIDHKIIAKKFKRAAAKMAKPDVVVASMPPHDFAHEAVLLAKENNIPVLVDIRDRWPDIFIDHIPSELRKSAKTLLAKDFQVVKETMQLADGLVAATDTFLEWGLKYAGRGRGEADTVFYLGNKKRSNTPIRSNKIHELAASLKDKFVVTFVGTFASYHNPSILLDCALKLLENNISFVLAGNGEFFNAAKIKAANLSNVILPGWLAQDEISALLQLSHVGVCPTAQTIDIFPNKAFAYLSAGLPLISAFQGDLKEIIESHQIGLYYPPNDVDALVTHIKRLSEDGEFYKEMSENALTVFNDRFDADRIYEKYVGHIEQASLVLS